MTAPNANSPWITAKLRSADGSAGFAVANSANSNLLTARSDGAVQLLNGAFLDGRTDYFGSAGTYYGYVAVPTNIVHDVTLVDPRDSTGGATNRVVFYNAQTDAEYLGPNITKFRASTYGWDAQQHINFDSQISFHWHGNQMYHFRAYSALEGKDTFWVRPDTNGEYNSNTRADMYVSGKVGIGTLSPGEALQVSGAVKVTGTTTTILENSASLDYLANGARIVSFGSSPATPATFELILKSSDALAGGSRLFVDPGGNIGIGTVSPAAGARLDVQGGNVNVGGSITATGNIIAGGAIHASYQDVAEWVPATHAMVPGTVVVLNPQHGSEVMPSGSAYDTSVAGVVSAQPGLILGEASSAKEMIATTGRVKVRVDARPHPVKVGDLLVTSDVPGTAMRSEPIDVAGVKLHRPGTLIGKALEPLAAGTGEILVLLSLQ